MYGYQPSVPDRMLCQHVADWCQQVLSHISNLREQGFVKRGRLLDQWQEQFAGLEAEAIGLSVGWHWGSDGSNAVGGLLDRAYSALDGFVRLLTNGEAEYEEEEEEEIRPVPPGGHQLPPLPYPYDALEPYIDAQTMQLHHDKHHQAYVNGLNKAEEMMLEARRTGQFDLIKHWEREAAFNGAGHYLHTIFWESMAPGAGGPPPGDLAAQIDQDFGGFDAFKEHFSAAAEKVEGGGWAIWVWSPRANRTEILTAEKHQNLSQWDQIPLLPLDVWEHAYYLKYQDNRRAYVDNWWNLVNWPAVADRYEKARELIWRPF